MTDTILARGQKRLGMVRIRGVDFALQRGEIHAPCGETAQESRRSSRSCRRSSARELHGECCSTVSQLRLCLVRDSQARGLSVIYQELPLVEEMSVAANIFLGAEPVVRALAAVAAD